jgi:uncharacterized protein (DUF697 family)
MSEQQLTCERIIRNHVLAASGLGLIPIPMASFAAVTGVQLDMVIKISQLYGKSYAETQVRSWITALAGGTAARLGAEALKIIPGFGSVLGGLSMAALSGASTYAIGKVVARHYEQGGTPENFNASAFSDYYKEQFRKGKEFVESVKDKKEDTPSAPADASQLNEELVFKLREIANMKDAGIITEDEFKQLKEKIISQYI